MDMSAFVCVRMSLMFLCFQILMSVQFGQPVVDSSVWVSAVTLWVHMSASVRMDIVWILTAGVARSVGYAHVPVSHTSHPQPVTSFIIIP